MLKITLIRSDALREEGAPGGAVPEGIPDEVELPGRYLQVSNTYEWLRGHTEDNIEHLAFFQDGVWWRCKPEPGVQVGVIRRMDSAEEAPDDPWPFSDVIIVEA